MNERDLENMLERVLQQDFSAGTDEFRDTLLARCLEAFDFRELDDDDLELFAAAGDLFGDNPSAK